MAYLNHKLTSRYRSARASSLASNSRLRCSSMSNNRSQSVVVAIDPEHHQQQRVHQRAHHRAGSSSAAFINKSSLTVDNYTRAEMSQACAPQWLASISALAARSMFLTSLGIVLQPSRLDPPRGVMPTYAT